MNWFSIHTYWLQKETQELSNNSIYKENHQFIDHTLISTGIILVHKESTERYPVSIVYPEATPYVPPTVYVLGSVIDGKTAVEYSRLTPEEIKNRVSNNMSCIDRRHQNEDGSICFIETGDLHSENAEIYSIKDIIKRVRIWLSGKIPKDSAEVELFHHFSHRTNDIQYLLPDLFFDTEIIKGQYYAAISNYLLASALSEGNVKIKKTYIGAMIIGQNKAGVMLAPKTYVKKELILFAQMPNVKDLIIDKNSEQKLNAINEYKLIEGYWWDISKEPDPFSSIAELANYIGDKDEDKGFNELITHLQEPLHNLDEVIHVGIRFPGRVRGKDWQMLRLKKGSRLPLIQLDPEELKKEMENRLVDYSIEAVNQEYFTEGYFHMRNQGRADRNILKTAKVSMIGCGAIGSETSDALNKAGIGEMFLVDKDSMKAHNATRHCLGLDKVSLPKVYGMAEKLTFHNPFVNMEYNNLKEINILTSKLDDYLPESVIGVSTIADDNIEAYLNEQAIIEGRTVFYCRALRGGKSARIFRVIPEQDACKRCLAIYHAEKNSMFLPIEEDENLPAITNECNNPVRPASAADLKIIAGILSRIIIDFLHGNNSDKNHWIWSTESLNRIELEESCVGLINTNHLPPHPQCPTCQKLENVKVNITKEAYEFIKNESSIAKGVETGGVLVGYKSSRGEYVILKGTGPGPNATKTSTLFEKDEEYCQKELESALKVHGEKGLYLGEWHYHALGKNQPSGIDIKSLTEIAIQREYRIDKPIMIILSKALECAITIHDKKGSCVQLPLNVIESA